MDAGELVPDEVIVGMITDRIGEETPATGSCWTAFPATRSRPTPSARRCADWIAS